MKIILISILSMFIFSSCAHHHKKEGGHHHHKCSMKNCSMKKVEGEAFNKHCAMSISMGDMHVEGKKDYKIEHGGETYYFSTKEKMETFQVNLDKNIEEAQRHWSSSIEAR